MSRHYRDFPLRDLVAAKGDQLVSVCIPAHDEAATIGDVVAKVRRFLGGRLCLVDEVLVVDDHSRDDTGKAAAHAGARVVDAAEVLADVAGGPGKGEALWRSLYVPRSATSSSGATPTSPTSAPASSAACSGPLITDPDVALRQGLLRAAHAPGHWVAAAPPSSRPGRRWPRCSRSCRRSCSRCRASSADAGSLLERLPFVRGYGVDIGLLIDVAEAVGTGRHRPGRPGHPRATATATSISSGPRR